MYADHWLLTYQLLQVVYYCSRSYCWWHGIAASSSRHCIVCKLNNGLGTVTIIVHDCVCVCVCMLQYVGGSSPQMRAQHHTHTHAAVHLNHLYYFICLQKRKLHVQLHKNRLIKCKANSVTWWTNNQIENRMYVPDDERAGLRERERARCEVSAK